MARTLSRDWKFWLLTPASALTLGLVITNLQLQADNRARRAEIAARQQSIDEAVQLSRFNGRFIQALAELAAQTNDESIRALLADHGVTFTVAAPNAAPPAHAVE